MYGITTGILPKKKLNIKKAAFNRGQHVKVWCQVEFILVIQSMTADTLYSDNDINRDSSLTLQ